MPTSASTQSVIPIDNIRNDVVVVKGGGLRAILQVSSVNFALKSRDEQEAIIFQYQNFLNSLDFPIQILVNSRLMNVDEYIANIEKMITKQQSELLKMQTSEYTKFIQRFVQEANIVSTDFYLIVPFSVIEVATTEGGAGERAKSLIGKQTQLGTMETEKFLYFKGQLMQRVDFTASGLHRMGISANMLRTDELISLFWSIYNGGDLRKRGSIKPMF
ncbi:MAG: hypothetical protein R3251_02915 [Candidatus Spechtbacterales bacterium]|nr:hypothetical protein [Candidatus Spechtbacterales bacterium]